ncbi:RluA family pseudouridine synthase [Patescibacteria group bacterium]
MDLKIIYEDENIRVINKPAGVNSDDFEKRVHRLDKDTSGILILAKNDEILGFLQKQFKKRSVEKNYIALAIGSLKNNHGIIETMIDRSPSDRRKQKAFMLLEPGAGKKRMAKTEYQTIKRFQDYTLLKVIPKTGRKHQIRTHLAYLGHPIAGDKLYGFKNQPTPKNLNRQFLHANKLKIKLSNGREQEFKSNLPADLEEILKKLK